MHSGLSTMCVQVQASQLEHLAKQILQLDLPVKICLGWGNIAEGVLGQRSSGYVIVGPVIDFLRYPPALLHQKHLHSFLGKS